jgi:hypothetical protein
MNGKAIRREARRELLREFRQYQRNGKSREGKLAFEGPSIGFARGWIKSREEIRSAKPYVVKPTVTVLVPGKETGRSEKYHQEQVEMMCLRQEMGMGLWEDDSVPDEEVYEVELTVKESAMIDGLMSLRGKTHDSVTAPRKQHNLSVKDGPEDPFPTHEFNRPLPYLIRQDPSRLDKGWLDIINSWRK